jgi:isochorismate hydrolase
MQNKTDTLLTREDCLLLIIDVQEKLIPVIANHDRIVSNIIKLTQFASIINLPVLVVEQKKLGPTLALIKNEIHDFNPISKIDFDAAKCPAFLDALKKSGKKKLIIAGIESHICVTQTVIHLLPEYTIHVISDAISSRTMENCAIAIERLRSSGAIISSTEMIIYELLGRAGTNEYKTVLPLIKSS